jgi:hypothetical protein
MSYLETIERLKRSRQSGNESACVPESLPERTELTEESLSGAPMKVERYVGEMKAETVCWHCRDGLCPCVTCGEGLRTAEAGPCVVCHGTGRVWIWVQ